MEKTRICNNHARDEEEAIYAKYGTLRRLCPWSALRAYFKTISSSVWPIIWPRINLKLPN